MGHGIAVLPEGIVKGAIDSGRLIELKITDEELVRTHYVVIHKNKRINPSCGVAIDMLKNNSI